MAGQRPSESAGSLRSFPPMTRQWLNLSMQKESSWMSLPDQSHINRVRDALWDASGSNASVMVGSGLTKGAARVEPRCGRTPATA